MAAHSRSSRSSGGHRRSSADSSTPGRSYRRVPTSPTTGETSTERFSFKVDGDAVLGTASFLGVRRGIVDGSLQGERVVFQTRTQEVRGDFDNPVSVSHRYRGTITGDTIAFTMQSEGGSSSVPVEFTATRSTRRARTFPPTLHRALGVPLAFSRSLGASRATQTRNAR